MMGKKVGDEQYVMDVKLKKQYSIGSGHADVNHSDAGNLTRIAGETFLPAGNAFERSESRTKSHNVIVGTSHKFTFLRMPKAPKLRRKTLAVQPCSIFLPVELIQWFLPKVSDGCRFYSSQSCGFLQLCEGLCLLLPGFHRGLIR